MLNLEENINCYVSLFFFLFFLCALLFLSKIVTIDLDVKRRVPLEGQELEEYRIREKEKAAATFADK